jgi:hypothetical protein
VRGVSRYLRKTLYSLGDTRRDRQSEVWVTASPGQSFSFVNALDDQDFISLGWKHSEGSFVWLVSF